MPYRAILTSRNYPLEIMFFLAAVLAGVSFFRHEPPPPLQRLLPHGFLTYWYITTLIGGLFGLLSALLPRRRVGQAWVVLHVEMGALYILAGVLFAYAMAILTEALIRGLPSLLLVMGYLVCVVLRIVEISRSIRLVKRGHQPEGQMQ